MHLQIRTSLGKGSKRDGAASSSGVSIERDPLEVPDRALLELLELLAARGYNLEMAGGDAIEAGGEFVFAVEHTRTQECADMLEAEGYRRVRILELEECELSHEPGQLRDCLARIQADGRRVDEIYVGVRRDDGTVPVQILTIRPVAADQGS